MLLQIFHNLSTKTRPSFFQNVDVGHIVNFSFRADPNYGHLSGSIGTKQYVCTVKSHWQGNDYKFNFKPLNENHINVLITLADTKTGFLHACEIHDKGYCIIEVRSEKSGNYYHPTPNSYIDVLFEPSAEPCWSIDTTNQWRVETFNRSMI